MFFSTMDITNLEYHFQFFIQILIQNLLNHPLTLVRGLIGDTQQDVFLINLQTTRYRINELTEYMDANTANYLTHGTSDTLKKLYCLNITTKTRVQSTTKKFPKTI